MESLITLGSISACVLGGYKLGSAIAEDSAGPMEVMEVADSLMSAGLILCIVRIGKFLEEKAKRRITQMAN
jgi:hypothetical protein